MSLFYNELIEDMGGIKQDQRFVLSLLNANTFLIYTNSTLFQNLAKYNSNGKDYTVLLSQVPKLKGWDVCISIIMQWFEHVLIISVG